MPELPEVEAWVQRVTPRLVGQTICSLEIHRPLVFRCLLPAPRDESAVAGRQVTGLTRRGKVLLMALQGDLWLVTHFMLAGSLTWPLPASRLRTRDYYTFHFVDGTLLRYHDTRGMGKAYLTDDPMAVPGIATMAPDALANDLGLDDFLQRLRSHPGEVKGVLTHERLVAGIGNAYADEVLFAAGIYPFHRVSRLSDAQRRVLYVAMRACLTERIHYLLAHWPGEMNMHWREGLQVHGRAGEPCFRCGTPISEINIGKRPTNFCRHCQPGLLVRN